MTLDERQLEAVLADRAAAEPWRILGDALESAGDPRGRLLGLMLAHEAKPALKLITARKEWLKTHAAALVPPDLDDKTLVWSRGFLSEATIPGARLLELIDHPSFRLLDHAVLGVGAPLEQLAGRVLPWRSVELLALDDGRVDPRPVLEACPRLERLVLHVPAEQTELAWSRAAGLRELELSGATSVMLLEAAEAFPGLKALRFEHARQSPSRAEWENSGLLGRLERLAVSYGSYLEAEGAFDGPLPSRLTVFGDGYEEDLLPHGVLERETHEHHEENAWLVHLPFEAGPAARDFGFGHQLRELASRTGRVRFGGVELAVTELRADAGSLALGDFAQLFAEKSGTGRCLGFAVSTSRHQVASWVVKNGPARTGANYYRAEELFRRNVELLFGVDPGPRGLEQLRRGLEGLQPTWLLGKVSRFWPGLITDSDTTALTGEELEAEELGDEYEDEDGPQSWEDVIEAEEAVAAEAAANAAAPVLMESESEPVVKVVPSVLDVVPAPLGDEALAGDESEDDEDEEPFRDALDATVYEIWTQTPVEPDDDLEEPVTRAYNPPEEQEGVLLEGAGQVSVACAHCGTAATTEPCTRCGDSVCATCGDGDEDQRVCHECEPAAS
ncbi:MAG: FYVE zinc finger domain-containing protein [Myxococcaceae bacterium]